MSTFLRPDDLWRETRQALRSFRRAPVHATAIVSLLAVAIGANVAIFSLVSALLFRELPVDRPDELVAIRRVSNGVSQGISIPLYEELRQGLTSLAVAAVSDVTAPLSVPGGNAGEPSDIPGALVSGNYFRVLRARAAAGRLIGEDDDRFADPQPVIVLSHALWQSRFGADPGVIGRDVLVAGTRFTIVGVAAKELRALGGDRGLGGEFWIPLHMQPAVSDGVDRRRNPGSSILRVFGRFEPGASIEQVQAQADARYRQLGAPIARPDSTLQAVPAHRGLGDQLATQYWPPLRVLMVGVALLLVIACANVAGLLIARAGTRHREVALRAALGGSRARLIRQSMIESLLLAGMGGAIGVALSSTGARALIALAVPDGAPVLDFSIDSTVLLFAVAISVGATLLFGLLPALFYSRRQLDSALRHAARGSTGRTRRALNLVVVGGQVALAVILVTGAVAFTRSLMRLYSTDTGFDRRDTIIAAVDARPAGVQSPQQYAHLARDLVERIGAQPGVASVTVATSGFFGGGRRSTRTYRVDDQPYDGPDAPPLYVNQVSNDYLAAFGVPLIAGRHFTAGDRPGATQVTVVNEEFVRRYLPGRPAIGRRLTLDNAPDSFEIVGVVRDTKMNNVRDTPLPQAFLPFEQSPSRFNHVCIRMSRQAAADIAAVRAAILATNPRLRIGRIDTLDAAVAATLSQDILLTRLSAVFGAAAIVLVCFGVYGVISTIVLTRTREIGVRLAIGAQPGRILAGVIRHALWTVTPGLVAGIVAVVPLGNLITSQLFEAAPGDPVTLTIVVSLLVAITALSAYLPARRAASIDPLIALRSD